MRIRLNTKKIEFVYYNSRDGIPTTIDPLKEFVNMGGALSPNTEIELSEYFPASNYQKTALTDNMPANYLCMGSMSLSVFEGSEYKGGIALSIYSDKTGHDPTFGDHKNIFMQYETSLGKNHSDHIPNRHVKLSDKLTIKTLFDGNEVKSITL